MRLTDERPAEFGSLKELRPYGRRGARLAQTPGASVFPVAGLARSLLETLRAATAAADADSYKGGERRNSTFGRAREPERGWARLRFPDVSARLLGVVLRVRLDRAAGDARKGLEYLSSRRREWDVLWNCPGSAVCLTTWRRPRRSCAGNACRFNGTSSMRPAWYLSAGTSDEYLATTRASGADNIETLGTRLAERGTLSSSGIAQRNRAPALGTVRTCLAIAQASWQSNLDPTGPRFLTPRCKRI